MQFRPSTPPTTAGLPLAPMIDIVFLLLIFFIVTWSFARFETELDISVPAAAEGQPPQRSVGEIIVNVQADGTIVVNSVPLTEEQLFAKLVKVSEFREDQAVILRGDEDADYRDIIRVLDVCKRARIWNVAFATSRPRERPPSQP